MVARTRIPERGDVVWLDFNPTKGREQAGRRPALIISSAAYNRAAQLALVCPITSKQKGYPYEVAFSATPNIDSGAILTDQIRSVSWKERKAQRIEAIPPRVMVEVSAKLKSLIG